MTRAEILDTLRAHQDDLRRRFGVVSVGVFGSAARDELRPDSDVDVLVEFDPDSHIGIFGFVRLQRHLESLLGRTVDLATPEALKKHIRDQILRELVRAA